MALLRCLCVVVALVSGVAATLLGQQPQPARPNGVPRPPDPGPMFFSERWKNPKSYPPGTLPLTGVTQDVVTTPDVELNVYDPNAKYIPEYRKVLRWGSWPEDWEGPTCLRIYGVERPEIWAGSCGAVTVTLRHTRNFVDLSNRGRVIWGTYVSGFHVARLVVKLADGTFLVGDPGTGTPDVSHIENEVVLSSLRWLKLQVPETVTRGSWVEKPDLSKVDEIGWTQLMPGSGHGVGGFVAVSKFEVWGRPVPRTSTPGH
jgi:hypothetical protein